jgi:ABC-2 type transport system ATP-binding protein
MNDSSSGPPEAVIRIAGLTRRFGPCLALDDVSLTVPRGAVFGLVGPNGAGKTTLIKHVLGLLRAQSGTVRVFDRDPVTDPEGVLGRVGYLSEDRDLPGWMRVAEYLRYIRAFYPRWDDAYAEELRLAFALDSHARIKDLSRGQTARLGLLAALAHRPDLLVLDEPSSGLDPVVRRDILTAIIRTIADEGRTVLFSSHLLDEVERVSDHVALIDQGKVALCAALDDVKEGHHRLTLRFDEPQARPPVLAGALSCEGGGREWTVVCNGRVGELRAAAARLGARVVAEAVPSLDEIFVARVGKQCHSEAEG